MSERDPLHYRKGGTKRKGTRECNKPAHPYCCDGTMNQESDIEVSQETADPMVKLGWATHDGANLTLTEEGGKALSAYSAKVIAEIGACYQ